MKNDVMARRYARALYELGREEGLEKQFLTDLQNVVALIGENEEFRSIVISPLYDIILKKKILNGVSASISISKYMVNFLNILLEKDRFNFIEDILTAYTEILDEVSGRVKAQVISAVGLNPEQQKHISTVFSKLMAKEVDLEVEVDASLIGGLVVEVEGMIYDGSIKTQLSKIKQSLKGEI